MGICLIAVNVLIVDVLIMLLKQKEMCCFKLVAMVIYHPNVFEYKTLDVAFKAVRF